MANTVARENARARHMAPRSMEEYLRDLARDAADLEAAIMEAARICLKAGRVPADFANDPELAAAMTELTAVP